MSDFCIITIMGLKATTPSLGEFSRRLQGLPGEDSSQSACGKSLPSRARAPFPPRLRVQHHPGEAEENRHQTALQSRR